MLKWLKSSKLQHPLQEVKEAHRVVDALGAKDPVKALEEASHWLGSINKTAELRRHRRFELLGMLDVATRKAQGRVADVYVTQVESKHHQEQSTWQTANEFWKLLGDGYLTCAKPSSHSDDVGTFKPLLPLLTTRGLRALRQQMKWLSMRYGAPRAEFWAECGRFFSLAESAAAAAAPLELYPGGNALTSPCDEFLRAMVFWSSLPGTLSPVEQDIAERLIVHLTPKFRFNTAQADGCDYFFDVDGSRPPLRFVRTAPVTAATRYFDMNEARQALQAMHSLISSTGNLPAGVDCGPAAEINVTVRVLNHLVLNWAKELPPRAAGRRKTEVSLRAVVGYEQVLAVVEDGGLQGAAGTRHAESWTSEDLSVSGCGALVPGGKGERLRVGMLVALQPETAQEVLLSVGIIRRVNHHANRQHRIGIQIISKSALPVYLRSLPGARQGRSHEAAILLNEQPAANGSLYVVARRDLFSAREPVEAAYGKAAAAVILEAGEVVESGNDFDWLRYTAPAPGV